eukprot:1177948-Prorocentrum_minimum.AAC.2
MLARRNVVGQGVGGDARLANLLERLLMDEGGRARRAMTAELNEAEPDEGEPGGPGGMDDADLDLRVRHRVSRRTTWVDTAGLTLSSHRTLLGTTHSIVRFMRIYSWYVIYIRTGIAFSVFPTVLAIVTLFAPSNLDDRRPTQMTGAEDADETY